MQVLLLYLHLHLHLPSGVCPVGQVQMQIQQQQQQWQLQQWQMQMQQQQHWPLLHGHPQPYGTMSPPPIPPHQKPFVNPPLSSVSKLQQLPLIPIKFLWCSYGTTSAETNLTPNLRGSEAHSGAGASSSASKGKEHGGREGVGPSHQKQARGV